MKIILKQDVPELGTFGEVVKVADGYARNYLIPRSFAVEATVPNMNQFEAERGAWERKALKIKGEAEGVASELEPVSLNFQRKAGEDERLFGSVTSMDIEAALKEKGFDIDRKHILLGEPIKKVGVFTVGIKLHRDVTGEIKVWVVKE